MKYTIKNWRCLFRRESMAGVCLVCGFLVAAFTMLFLYGLNYQVQQKQLAEVNAVQLLNMEIPEAKRSLTWKRVRRCMRGLNSNTLDGIGSVTMKAIIDGKLSKYKGSFNFDFTLDSDGKPAYLDMTEMMQSYGGLSEGRWFTEKEFNQAAKVAVGLAYEQENKGTNAKYTRKYESEEKDGYVIDGIFYKKIGSALLWNTPSIPVTCLREDAPVIELAFEFKNSSLSVKQYRDIKEVFEKEFQGEMNAPDISMEDLDGNYYLLMTLVLISAGILTAVVLSLLVTYICQQQWENYRIYRICGKSRGQCIASFTSGCMILALCCFAATLVPYLRCAVPRIQDIMGYFREGYTPGAVLWMGVIFMAGNGLVSGIICTREEWKCL